MRRAVRTSIAEGVIAEFVSICAGGGVLTAWALHFGASPVLVAALVGVPAFAQALQLPAARLTARLGARRTALMAAVAARQPYALLVPLPWLPVDDRTKVALLVVTALATSAAGAVSQHAWFAWMTELFRPPMRVRVLARRGPRLAFLSAVGGLAVGVLLDRSGAGRGAVLGSLAFVAWAAGSVAALLLRRQHAPRAACEPREGDVSLRAALDVRPVRRGLRYVFAWNTALGLTAGVSAMYMIQQLGLGFVGLALHGLAVASGSLLVGPLWGRLIDRVGVGAVIALSTLGAAVLPFLWALSSSRVIWPVILDAALAGALLGGQSAAATALPVAVAPRGHRSEVVAAYSTVSGFAFGAATLAGGLVASRLPFFVVIADHLFIAKKLVFVAGGTVRLVAAFLGFRLFRSWSRR